MLTIAPIPLEELPYEESHLAGNNAFQCRTCPYQMVLDQRYFERKEFNSKEIEDVLGGEDSWKNVDKTSGMC